MMTRPLLDAGANDRNQQLMNSTESITQSDGDSLATKTQKESPSGTKERRKSYPRRAKFALALGATIIAILIAEVVVRALGVAPIMRTIKISDVDSPYQISANPILGYEHKVNYANENPDQFISFASTNSHGLRDTPRMIQKPPGVRRIILLGDSVVESMEVRELDNLMNRQMEMLYPDSKTEVLNFGVNGYCTRAEVELLRTKGLQFEPDLVVLVFVENDYSNINGAAGATIAGLEHMKHGMNLDSKSRTVNHLARFSHLFRLACVYLHALRQDVLDDPCVSNAKALGDNNVVQGLDLLRKLSVEHGFDVVIAIWPAFYDDSIVDINQIPGTNELLIERLAKMYDFPSVRLSKRFERHWRSLGRPENPRNYYTIGDSVHVNEAGSRVAAQILKTILDDLPELNKNATKTSATAKLDAAAVEEARRLGLNTRGYSFAAAVTDLGAAEQEQGRLENALYYYQLALEIDPGSPVAHARLGQLYLQTGKSKKAQYHLERAQR